MRYENGIEFQWDGIWLESRVYPQGKLHDDKQKEVIKAYRQWREREAITNCSYPAIEQASLSVEN